MAYVIIGNGIAGVCAAEAIRECDPRGPITMIGDEPVTPYSRPMISMVLEGTAAVGNLTIRPNDFYEKMGIQTLFGSRVSAVDVIGRRVRVGSDRWVPYDKLLIASGADPRPWKVPGVDLDNIFYMRTRAQAESKLEAVATARKGLVLGGGLVGFKAAYGLMKRGLDVTMLITSDYPLSLQVDAVAGNMIREALLLHGLKVEVGVSIEAFEGNGSVSVAHTSDGRRLPCDMVVIGKGVLPARSFVPRGEIPVDLGIIVDAHMQTGAPDVYAAGDVAETVDIARKVPWVNAIWPEAALQGRIAGMNMAGRKVDYKGSLSRNVLRILDLDVMTIGIVDPPDAADLEVMSELNRGGPTYRKMVYRDNRLIGALLVNGIEQGGLFLSLIRNEMPLTVAPSRLLSPTFNVRQLLNY
jgi:NAD(P)H-nitrite reductase large subunit